MRRRLVSRNPDLGSGRLGTGSSWVLGNPKIVPAQKSAGGKFHHIGNEKTPYSELIPAVEPTPGLSEE